MKIIVAGIGTDVGKTLVSAILVEKFQADYWKPLQTGSLDETDTMKVKALTSFTKLKCHQEAYSFTTPASPHVAASRENVSILPEVVMPPITSNTLIIEMSGGVLSPMNDTLTQLDHFSQWDAKWVIVSRHYLGSINHTLLTYHCLKQKGVDIAGFIFNGSDEAQSEGFILKYTGVPCLGRLSEELFFDTHTIKKYVDLWQIHF